MRFDSKRHILPGTHGLCLETPWLPRPQRSAYFRQEKRSVEQINALANKCRWLHVANKNQLQALSMINRSKRWQIEGKWLRCGKKGQGRKTPQVDTMGLFAERQWCIRRASGPFRAKSYSCRCDHSATEVNLGWPRYTGELVTSYQLCGWTLDIVKRRNQDSNCCPAAGWWKGHSLGSASSEQRTMVFDSNEWGGGLRRWFAWCWSDWLPNFPWVLLYKCPLSRGADDSLLKRQFDLCDHSC